MKRSWTSLILLAAVLGVLTLFLGLQYNWLVRAGEAERDQMQKRVDSDTKAFADDFNREIQAAYFNFQVESAVWRTGDYRQFVERFEYWRSKTAYPELISGFVYFPKDAASPALIWDGESRAFKPGEVPADIGELRKHASRPPQHPFDDATTSLILPIRPHQKVVEEIRINRNGGETVNVRGPAGATMDVDGALVILLDRATLTERMLPELVQKYFPNGDYVLNVADRDHNTVFGTPNAASDSSAEVFSMRPDNLIFFATRDLSLPRTEGDTGNVVVHQRVETVSGTRVLDKAPPESQRSFKIELQEKAEGAPRTAAVALATGDGGWEVSATHSSGSIDAYVESQFRRSMLIGLALYLLLVGSIAAIVISAVRSRRFAQRQVDFVSSVSHEFRTPLAVIYSAGENLADGVAVNERRVEQYGELIKREGKKLSSMVEQILSFAGARSGKRTFKMEPVDAGEIVREAIEGSMPLVNERNGSIVADIGKLPGVRGDAEALSSAVRNLISNGIKYGGSDPQLTVAAFNGGDTVKISVEDQGIGISDREVKRIFEPFFRSREVIDAQIHGNGLGLSLVKEIVDAHGGTISVDSQPGRGTKVTLEIPAIREAVQ